MKLSGKLYKCNTCFKKKSIQEYYLKSNGKITDHRCKYCTSKYKKEYRSDNYDRVRNQEDVWKHDNKEAIKQSQDKYRENNKEVCNKRNRDYYKKNIHTQRARIAAKRVLRLDRYKFKLSKTDESKIKSIYKMCNNISKKTGVPHHVDHIVPLLGELVSGLHVPWNLQVIPAKDNLTKGNKFIEDIV